MKPFFKFLFLSLLVVGGAAVARAQNPKLQIDSLDSLENKAAKVIDVDIDEKLMGMVGRMIHKSNPSDEDAKKIAEAIAGIKGIFVRSYEFETEGQYTPEDVERIRSQVKGAGWDRLVGVRSKKAGENAEVYVLYQGDKVLGLAIIAADPKELTVVNIIGSIDLDRLSDLDGDFGVPRLEITRDHKESGN